MSRNPLACAACGTRRTGPGGSCPSCLLELGIAPGGADSPARPPPTDDRYRIVRELGAGGMGTVYLAEQTAPVRRQVALKVIKRGMDSARVVARFETERQALAVMDHPAVARVYEAGELPTGQPYFSMEYVAGRRITDFADEERLPTPDRLRLFARLCDGVQHAHQKGVIHRDIKPSNVLVARNGEDQPKLIDFGVAKAIAERWTDDTASAMTELGVVVGTPQYMSPEQCELSPLGVDTRSDVYSLGVLLYELLSGCAPFDTTGIGFDEIRRRIRQVEPPTPSARLTVADEPTTSIAVRRRVDVRTLRRQLAGDLDWITLKALAKEPEQRYQTAAELAADVRRHLADQPIVARPPSRRYRAGKFVRRNKLAVASAGTILAVLVLSAVVAARFAHEEGQRRRELERVVAFQSEMLSGVEPEQMGRRLFDDLRQRVEVAQRRRDVPDTQIERTLADLDAALAGVNPTDAAVRVIDDEILQRATADLDGRFVNEPSIEARLRQTVVDTLLRLGLVQQAEPHAERVVLIYRQHGTATPADALAARIALGTIRSRLGRQEEARDIWAAVIEDGRRQLGNDHEVVVSARHQTGVSYYRESRHDEAEPLLLESIEAFERIFGPEHPRTVGASLSLALVYRHGGRAEEAERLFREGLEIERRAYGAADPRTLKTASNLAATLNELQRHAEAEALFLEVLEAQRRVLGADHNETVETLNNLATLYGVQRRFDESEAMLETVIATLARTHGEQHAHTLMARLNLAFLHVYAGRFADAEPLYRPALDGLARTRGQHDPQIAVHYGNLAYVYTELGRPDDAAWATCAGARLEPAAWNLKQGCAWSLVEPANASAADVAEARALALAAAAAGGAGQPYLLGTLARIHRHEGDIDGALEHLRQAIAAAAPDDPAHPSWQTRLAELVDLQAAGSATLNDGQ